MFWWILLGIIIFIILVYMVIGFYFHHLMFGKRFSKDPIVKYYNVDMFEGFKFEPIEFDYKKNKLKGNIYYYEHNNHKGLIVFSHGMFTNHEAYLQDIEYYAKNGYKVLGFDYYGTEYSDGKNLKGLGNSLACLDFVLGEVLKKYNDKKIFVVGHSWGGFASLCIAKYRKRISGIVTISPFITAPALLKAMVPSYLYPAIPFFILKDYFGCGKYIFNNGIKILNESHIKTLVLHSKDDHMVKYYSNTYLLKEYVKKENIEFLIVEGKRHNPNYSIEAIEYTLKINEKLTGLPENEKLEFRKSFDYQLMGKLDSTVMDYIVRFLDKEID